MDSFGGLDKLLQQKSGNEKSRLDAGEYEKNEDGKILLVVLGHTDAK